MKALAELTEREVLALAISSEEEDSRIYMAFAEDLAERYPASAKIFEEMAQEEEGHRHKLLELYRRRFGSTLPPIRREDVKGFLRRRPIWLTRNLPLDTIRKEAENMEFQAFSGMFPHRPEDVLAAGFAYTGISNIRCTVLMEVKDCQVIATSRRLSRFATRRSLRQAGRYSRIFNTSGGPR